MRSGFRFVVLTAAALAGCSAEIDFSGKTSEPTETAACTDARTQLTMAGSSVIKTGNGVLQNDGPARDAAIEAHRAAKEAQVVALGAVGQHCPHPK